jgi:hypothetical protein
MLFELLQNVVVVVAYEFLSVEDASRLAAR